MNFKKYKLFLSGVGLAFFVAALDQLTKYYFSYSLQPYQQIEVLPFFRWTLVFNTGAAFSILNDGAFWQRFFLITITLIAVIIFTLWLYKARNSKLLMLSLSLILGGALGNLWDRVFLGYVVDFILIYYENYYFPAFNLADSAITLGAGGLIYYEFIGRK